jgi:hypothetical protein
VIGEIANEMNSYTSIVPKGYYAGPSGKSVIFQEICGNGKGNA